MFQNSKQYSNIQQEEAEEPQQYNNEYVESLTDPTRDSVILEQQKLDEILTRIEDSLIGREWNEQKQKYTQNAKPLLNSNGVAGVMRFLKGYLHRGLFCSNLEEEEISKVMIEVNLTIIGMLYQNWWEYNIRKADLNSIINLVEHNIFFALKRAYGSGDRRHFENIQQTRTVETHTMMPNQQRVGVLNKLFKGGG